MTEAAANTGAGPTRPAPTTSQGGSTADFLYDTFYSAAIGGSLLAIFFLGVDSLARQPLFTPSLIGTVVFTDASASAAAEIQLNMVAYFTIIHFLAFLATGAGLAWLYRALGAYTRKPVFLVAFTFAVLTGGFAIGGLTLSPGVVAVVGFPWIAVGNLATSIAMVGFIHWSHRPDGGSSSH
ncbi:MAG: hypothetical protein U5R14_02465 [Gemmatimonadota bacterium]|nr:hypothetical protein [Gemmatimonadota bacterium]